MKTVFCIDKDEEAIVRFVIKNGEEVKDEDNSDDFCSKIHTLDYDSTHPCKAVLPLRCSSPTTRFVRVVREVCG
jgi:hypothetical protein